MSRDKAPDEADPDATIVHRPAKPGSGDPDATVFHRPAATDAAQDPDATRAHREPSVTAPDPEATAVHGLPVAPEPDPESTVMHRPAPAAEPDPESTVMHRPALAPEPDPESTVMHRPAPAPEPDPESTVMHRPAPAAEPDPESTVMHRPAPVRAPDPDATVMHRVAPDPGSTVMQRPAPQPESDATIAGGPVAPREEPAFDPEATVMVPTPGRRASASVAPGAPAAALAADGAPVLSGLNPLVAAANPLLAAVPQFRWTVSHADPAGLRRSLGARLEAFVARATALGLAEPSIQAARAALCALIDEAVLSTPWGAASGWASENLTRASRGADAKDPPDFFDRLEALEADPESDTDLLELLSVCLALGFEGRFREAPNGRIALSQARERIDDLIRVRRARPESLPLSVHWRGEQTVQRALPRSLALWVTASACALLLGGTYYFYATRLSDAAQPVFADLARLKAKPVSLPPTAKAAAAPAVRLSTLLAPLVKAGQLEIREDARSSTVTLNATDLFASGSATVTERHAATIQALAEALNAVAGPVTVTGHTDSRPIRTARFPSNWELSRARADSVVAMMAAAMKQPGRLRAEGVADSEPVAPNDSEANRRRNRRVEFILQVQP